MNAEIDRMEASWLASLPLDSNIANRSGMISILGAGMATTYSNAGILRIIGKLSAVMSKLNRRLSPAF